RRNRRGWRFYGAGERTAPNERAGRAGHDDQSGEQDSERAKPHWVGKRRRVQRRGRSSLFFRASFARDLNFGIVDWGLNRLFLNRSDEAIPSFRHGLDELRRIRAIAERLPNLRHDPGQRIVRDEFLLPDLLKDLRFFYHPV